MSEPNQESGFLSYDDGDGNPIYLDFDVFVTENHSTSAEATMHPVEKGVKFTDHIKVNPDRLTLEAIVTNTPITDRKLSSGQSGKSERVTIDTETRSVPLGIASPVNQGQSVLAFESFDRCKAVYDDIVALCKAAVPVNCITNLRTYEGMAITSVSVPVDVGYAPNNALRFSFELLELRIVSTQATQGSAQQKQNLDPAKRKRHKGTKSGREVKEAKQVSVLKQTLDALKGVGR